MENNNRKAFNFYLSYFDVYQELNDKDKLLFIDALLNRQFYGVEPTELKGMVSFAYISQKHNIDAQVEGFENKTKTKLTPPNKGGSVGGTQGGSVQEKEKEKGKEQYVNDKPFKDKVIAFIDWFNQQKEVHTGAKGKTKGLSKTDENNLKKLLKDYTFDDFKLAIPHLFSNQWAKDTNNLTPTHFLRVDNFNKYLNATNIKPKKSGFAWD